MVGIKAHLKTMQSLLTLESKDKAMIVGICGPAGIGKTTIARALHSRFSSSFHLSCFMENIRGIYNASLDDYGSMMCLQEKLLSKILNQNGMKLHGLGSIHGRLCDLKVLIILDDVDNLLQLEALANDTNWFGPGSRIIVTTEDQELLEQHGINNTYHVDLPTIEEARKIFCRYAFRRSLAPYGFEKLAERAIYICNNLPLGLRVIGSILRGKKESDWESILHRLERSSIPQIDAVLRVGYDSLHENDQSLFLLIAVFFNYKNDGYVEAMLADSDLDVRLGLKTLAYKSLIQLSTNGEIVMHKLLRQAGRQSIQRQEPWKRQILVDGDEIRDVLENDTGRSLVGISFDTSTIKDKTLEIEGARAFTRMGSLRFLRIYKTRRDTNVRVHEDMEFPPCLRLLHWEVYPGKCLSHTLRSEHLVELNFVDNNLEMLGQGAQPLGKLKKLNLSSSSNLEELPDLSNATNLEDLNVSECQSLVEIHSSVGNLQKLKTLEMDFCRKLQVVPSLFNLASLKMVMLAGCDQLRKLPDISTTITTLSIADTMLEEFKRSVRLLSHLESLVIYRVSPSVFSTKLMVEQSGADIERIPECIKELQSLEELRIYGYRKLASLPELPRSLTKLIANKCESLETIQPFPFSSQIKVLYFAKCFKLGPEARSVITQQASRACLPGRNIPREFNHRALGNFLAIYSNASRFKICLVVSPKQEMEEVSNIEIICRLLINGCPRKKRIFSFRLTILSEHLFIFLCTLLKEDQQLKQYSEILFQFSTASHDIEIIECGVQILTDISGYGSCESTSQQLLDEDHGSLSDGNLEYDAPRVENVKNFNKSIISVFIFLLSLIPSVFFYSFLKKHKDLSM